MDHYTVNVGHFPVPFPPGFNYNPNDCHNYNAVYYIVCDKYRGCDDHGSRNDNMGQRYYQCQQTHSDNGPTYMKLLMDTSGWICTEIMCTPTLESTLYLENTRVPRNPIVELSIQNNTLTIKSVLKFGLVTMSPRTNVWGTIKSVRYTRNKGSLYVAGDPSHGNYTIKNIIGQNPDTMGGTIGVHMTEKYKSDNTETGVDKIGSLASSKILTSSSP